ncbi:MAG: DNA mismatch repair endonuclease MutL [Christensenellales bacterium]
MTIINVLEPSIYNLISAGEVAVNPAGVVKELVENSLDAKATKIVVEVWGGGVDKIKVTDNGCGIDKSQVKFAFMPHATSKISTVDDIYNIGTLGFRGEALASICNVSKLSILTKVAEEDVGTYMEIEAGQIVLESERASNIGTEITVTNLFYNTPARLKFLGPKNLEQRELNKMMENLILSNPNIEFVYIVEDHIKFHTSGNGIESVISEVVGDEFLENCFKVDVQEGKYRLLGYGLLPSIDFKSKFTKCFINGRITQNHCMASAVQTAYVSYTMKGIIPTYILYFDLPYDEVDVNITPQKTDVKFQNDSEVYSWIASNVKKALLNFIANKKFYESDYLAMQAFDKSLNEPKENEVKQDEEPKKRVLSSYAIAKSVVNSIGNEDMTSNQFLNVWEKNKKIEEEKIDKEYNEQLQARKVEIEAFKQNDDSIEQKCEGLSSQSDIMAKVKGFDKNFVKQEFTQERFLKSNNKVLGVIFQTYILVEGDDNLFIIDQHAAHERYLYDLYMSEIEKQEVRIQDLLLPYTINADYDLANFLDKNIPLLKELGFEIEAFGSNIYKIEAVPMILCEVDLDKFIEEIFENKTYLTNTGEQLRDKIATRACKNAVKAGMTLNQSEIDKILDMIKTSKSPLLCPHGRPYVLKITKTDIEKWFKRIV